VHGLITHVLLSRSVARLQLRDSKAPERLAAASLKFQAFHMHILLHLLTVVMGENATP